jgi:hypothetical protein
MRQLEVDHYEDIIVVSFPDVFYMRVSLTWS